MTATPATLTASPKTFLERDDWMRAVLASDLPHAAVRVAIAMALRLHVNTGCCNPSFAKLAATGHVPERSTYRLVDLLEHSGWIAVTRLSGTRNNYTLVTPDIVTGANSDQTSDTMTGEHCHSYGRGTLDTMTGDHCQQGGSTYKRAKRAKIRERSESVSETDSPEPDSGEEKGTTGSNDAGRFPEFWSAYPRHEAKLAAEKAFAKALKLASPDQIIEGAKRYADLRAGQDPKFTKHASTWLSAGCWDDEPPRSGAPIIDGATGDEIPATPPPPQRRGGYDPAAERRAMLEEVLREVCPDSDEDEEAGHAYH